MKTKNIVLFISLFVAGSIANSSMGMEIKADSAMKSLGDSLARAEVKVNFPPVNVAPETLAGLQEIVGQVPTKFELTHKFQLPFTRNGLFASLGFGGSCAGLALIYTGLRKALDGYENTNKRLRNRGFLEVTAGLAMFGGSVYSLNKFITQ